MICKTESITEREKTMKEGKEHWPLNQKTNEHSPDVPSVGSNGRKGEEIRIFQTR